MVGNERLLEILEVKEAPEWFERAVERAFENPGAAQYLWNQLREEDRCPRLP